MTISELHLFRTISPTEFIGQVESAIQGVSAESLQAIARRATWRPEVIDTLSEIHPEFIPFVMDELTEPELAEAAVEAKPILIATLFTRVKSSPVAAARLGVWLAGQSPERSLAESEIIAGLKTAPDLMLNVLEARGGAPFEFLTEKIAAVCREKRFINGDCALAWLARSEVFDLDTRMLGLLGSSSRIAFLSANLLRNRLVESSVWAPLVRGIREPEFAVAALRNGLVVTLAEEARLKAVICEDPVWLVEYLSSFGESLEEAEVACHQFFDSHPSHYLLPDLRHWLHRLAFGVMCQRAVAQ